MRKQVNEGHTTHETPVTPPGGAASFASANDLRSLVAPEIQDITFICGGLLVDMMNVDLLLWHPRLREARAMSVRQRAYLGKLIHVRGVSQQSESRTARVETCSSHNNRQ